MSVTRLSQTGLDRLHQAMAGYVERREVPGTPVPGRFGWDGGLGTSWYTDAKADLIGILMTQRAWTSPNPPDVQRDFWKAAYAAIG